VTHDELRESLAAYALHALAPVDAREVEAHLETCEECQRDLAVLRQIAGDLASGVAMANPPAALRARVLTAIQPAGARPAFPRAWALGFAVAAAAAVILAGINVSLSRRLDTLSTRLATQEQVLALLASPTTKTATLTGSVQAKVRFVYDPDRKQGALVVSDLGDPGAEFVYQLWLIAGGEPQSAGVFRPVPGRPIIVPVAADFGRYQAVAISVERGPSGAPRPTTKPILVGTI